MATQRDHKIMFQHLHWNQSRGRELKKKESRDNWERKQHIQNHNW